MTALVPGSAGVALLLAAFVLSLLGRLSEHGIAYLAMNALGAALACWYGWASGLLPFVVLEGAWAAAALVRLAVGTGKKSGSPQTGEPR